MTPTQAGALLLYAARIDNRLGTLGKEEAKGWAEVLDGLDFERCRRAVVKHYQESDERIMPVHIRRLARTITDVSDSPIEIEPPVSRSGRQLDEPHAGEVLCPECAMIHRREESCEEFMANRERFADRRRELAGVSRSLTAAPAEGSAPPSPTHERALQRARAERGSIPWTPPPVEEPPVDDAGAPREERDVVDLAPSAQVLDSLRRAPMRSCLVCVAGPSGAPMFADVAEGRAAHRVVFGHDPRSDVPQREGASAGG
jgi:hypothetical protein